MFKNIYFIKEYLIGYSEITALFLTSNNIFKIISKNEVKNDMVIGVTISSYESISLLKRIRKEFPKNIIICGGIGVYHLYNKILLYADYVYFGEAFIFDEECILSNKYEKDKVKINRKIPFENIPIVKTGRKIYYFLTEVGCPYGCEFCYVSAVNKYQKIGDQEFIDRIKSIDKKLKNNNIVLLGNEGLIKKNNQGIFSKYRNNKYSSQSFVLKDYLKNPNLYDNQKIVRVGVELPTEKLRLERLPAIKKITDNELKQFITMQHKTYVQLFYIWNYLYTTEEDYEDIFKIAVNKNNFYLRINFTTLNIFPYIKLSKNICDHIERLMTTTDFYDSILVDKLKRITRVKVFPGKKNQTQLMELVNSYTLDKITQKSDITDSLIEKISYNVNNMELLENKNYIKTIRYK